MAKLHTPIPNLKLNDGNSIPMLAYGTGTSWGKYSGPEENIDRDMVESVKVAIGQGWRHFDCAEAYRNELELGLALKECGVPREEFYITTKVGQAVNDVSVSLATSLKKLQLSYVDLYLIHSPYFANEGTDAARLQEAWAGMEKLKAEGLAKSIGVSNWLPQHTEAVMATAKVPPAINQIEFHAYLPRKSVVEANKKHGIATSAYGPLVPLTKGHPGPVDEFVQALAKKYAVTESEILLRWVMEQDVVAITASRKEQRLSDYLRVARFKLTPEEVRRIGELGEEKHFRAFWGKKFAEDDRT